MTLEDWTAALTRELGIEVAVPIRDVLDLARDAAHGVERPAAPLTTFLVGYAIGAAGGDETAAREAITKATALALSWPGDTGDPPPAADAQ